MRAASLLFFLTGASGLVYQTVWMRMLIRVFGVTVYATTTIVAVFMAAFAIGALLGGRFTSRASLRRWGVLELAAGLAALAATFAIRALPSVYAGLAGDADTARVLLRFALTSACLLPPTILMGATLPLLVAASTPGRGDDAVARLYGANTLGAVVGVLGVGFFAIGALGETATVLVAVAVHVAVGGAAMLLPSSAGSNAAGSSAAGSSAASSTAHETASNPSGSDEDGGVRWELLVVAAGVAGLAALACEIAWTRLLVFVVGSSVYGFSSMLGMYLLGIGIGSLVLAKHLSVRALPALFVALGCAAALSLRVFLELGLRAHEVHYTYSPLLAPIDAVRFLVVSAAVVVPMTLVSGATFPLLVRAAKRDPRTCDPGAARSTGGAAQRTGALYAVNTIGGVAGALAAGFGAMPLVGAQGTIFFAAVAFFFVAAVLALAQHKIAHPLGVAGAGAAALALLVVAPDVDVTRAVLEGRFAGPGVAVKKHVETVDTTVTLAAGGGLPPSLFLNGIITSTKGPVGQVMAHLPLALHPDPHSALVICFGVGETFRAASEHVARVDVVELVDEVVRNYAVFDPANAHLLSRPGTRVFIDDGRNFLLRSQERYSAILIDGAPPIYSAGFVNLYSKEMIELAADHLDDGGVLMLWVPTLGYADDVWAITRALTDVFPTTAMWTSDVSGYILLGSRSPLPLSRAALEARLAARADRVPDWLTAESLVGGPARFIDDAELRARTRSVAPVTDDHPSTEYPLPHMLRGEPLLREAADLFRTPGNNSSAQIVR